MRPPRFGKSPWRSSVRSCSPPSGQATARAADKKPTPCNEDAMIVFDASGSMSGNQTLGIPNSEARIDQVRSALAEVLPSATKFRKVGLITFGPGPYNQCNVKLELKPTPDAAEPIMNAVNALVPAGKTPLTSAVEQAANVLDYKNKPGVIVVVTDGEETCGRSPCELAKLLHATAAQLTIHVIAFRYDTFSWTGGNSAMDLSASPRRIAASTPRSTPTRTSSRRWRRRSIARWCRRPLPPR